jgi:hypothetical protein
MKEKTMQNSEIVFSPIIRLGGQLTSMRRHREENVFKIFRIIWRGALLSHVAGNDPHLNLVGQLARPKR